MVYQLLELDKPSRQSSRPSERDDCHPGKKFENGRISRSECFNSLPTISQRNLLPSGNTYKTKSKLSDEKGYERFVFSLRHRSPNCGCPLFTCDRYHY